MTFDSQTPEPDEPIMAQSPVWPPPPTIASLAMPAFYPFRYVHAKVDGNVADFREGSMGINEAGIWLQGRCQPRAEIYQTILGLTFICCRGIGAVIAYFIMRYACLRDEQLQIPWANVQKIVTVYKRNQICIVYSAPNYKGKLLTFSLAMQYHPGIFDSLCETANAYAPGIVQPGKLKQVSGVITIILVIFLIVVIAIGAMKFMGTIPHS